jgi:hypothetical protein
MIAINNKMDYLKRAFGRICEEARQAAQEQQKSIIATAARDGFGGNTLLAVTREYTRAANEAADKMVRLAFDVTGSTAEPICMALRQGMTEFRDTLSNDLAQFFNAQASWAPRNATDGLGNGFLHETDKRLAAIVEDFSHGMAGGTRLHKDALVNAITEINNSPGAVAQGGVGNVQQAQTSVARDDIRSALAQFLNSKEVQALPPDDKQSIADVADVLGSELDKQHPDASKVGRWGKRLVEMAERLGIAVAASGLSHVLFG